MRSLLGLLFVLFLAAPVLAGNYEFVDATSLGASFNSSAIEVQNSRVMNVQAAISACTSCNGVFKLQASNDVAATPTNWTDVADSEVTNTATGTQMWNIVDPGYRKLRLVYTRAGGSGTVDARIEIKESGVPVR